MTKPPSREVRAEQVSLFEQALALDPRFVDAQSWLAIALASRVGDYMTDTAAADMSRAEDLTGRALAASPESHLAHHARGQVLRMRRRFLEAIPEYETALALNRNWVTAIYALGQCKLFIGSMEDTIPLLEQGHTAQPSRSRALRLVSAIRTSASAAIPRRPSGPLARKGAQRHSNTLEYPLLARFRLRPQRRNRTGLFGTR